MSSSLSWKRFSFYRIQWFYGTSPDVSTIFFIRNMLCHISLWVLMSCFQKRIFMLKLKKYCIAKLFNFQFFLCQLFRDWQFSWEFTLKCVFFSAMSKIKKFQDTMKIGCCFSIENPWFCESVVAWIKYWRYDFVQAYCKPCTKKCNFQ